MGNVSVAMKIRPVILSGGAGKRLWPLSRDDFPKQFLPLLGEQPLFGATLERVADRDIFLPPLIVCGEAHVEHVDAALVAAGAEDALVLVEPMGRNTAPAVALAAFAAEHIGELQLVLPSDHHVADPAAFVAGIVRGREAAAAGKLITFGIEPDHPETGYGYIAASPSDTGLAPVERFIEKPDRVKAERMIAAGGHYWNAGIFLWRADALLAELEAHARDVLEPAREAMAKAPREGRMIRPDALAFARSPSISIDYAVMEKTAHAMVVPVSMGWSDVGSWESLHGLADQDESGNVVERGSNAVDCRNCLIRSTGPRVIAVGVEELVIVATPEAVLVLPKSESQRVREAAAWYAESGAYI
jgi:mannose-1-phosphate guanylyltransferase/mannose-6-phosphate isomerase